MAIPNSRNGWVREIKDILAEDDLSPYTFHGLKERLTNWLKTNNNPKLAEQIESLWLGPAADDTDLGWIDANYRRSLQRVIDLLEIRFMNPVQKIFLSHKGTNKTLVRDFFYTLKALQLDPWLDEDAIIAGQSLERSLLKGMQDSYAAIFFITPDFRDENYLSTEIEYAIAEKRLKGESFSIITLQFHNDDGTAGVVPELLRRFVWKSPGSQLEAPREILRALPVKFIVDVAG